MKTKFKLWTAIIFIAIAIMVADSFIIFPIIFGLIGFVFAFWFYSDIKEMEEKYENFSD